MDRAWSRSDAWLLLAFASGLRGKRSLTELVSKADGIQHAIPNYEEVTGAIDRLTAAGLLTFHGDSFRVTPEGRSLVRGSPGRSVLGQLDSLERRLAEVPLPAERRRLRLSEADYREAVESYLG